MCSRQAYEKLLLFVAPGKKNALLCAVLGNFASGYEYDIFIETDRGRCAGVFKTTGHWQENSVAHGAAPVEDG